MKEERFPHPGNLLHWLGDQPGQKGSFRGSEENAAAGLQPAEQRETSTDGPGHFLALPAPDARLLVHMGLGAATWASADRPGKRTGVGCAETA